MENDISLPAPSPLAPRRKKRMIYMWKQMALKATEMGRISRSIYPCKENKRQRWRTPITAQKFILQQMKDRYHRQASSTRRSTYEYDKNRLWPKKAPIDGAVKSFLPTYEHKCCISGIDRYWWLSLSKPIYKTHGGGNSIFNTFRMIYTIQREIVLNSSKISPMRVADERYMYSRKVVHWNSLELTYWDYSQKTLSGNQFMLVLKGLSSELMRALQWSKRTSLHFESLFMGKWSILYKIPELVLTENRTQFTSKCLQPLRVVLGTARLGINA